MPRTPLARLLAGITLTTCALAGTAWADARSEQAAADLLRKRLQHETPDEARLLGLVHGKDVVVVAGSMDHIEQVLAAAGIPHTVIQPAKVAQHPFRADMIVMVDCPGQMPDAGVARIERFVRAGGLLYTTDWALKNVVEKAFPRTIAHTGGSTGNEVVPVKLDNPQNDNIMSRVLLRKGSQPQWWLEGGSYPIRVVDPKRVEVLAHSEEMGQRYKAAPVVVRFKHEDGEVIHVVSHFYRQMATSGPKVAAGASSGQFEGLSEADKKAFAASPAAGAAVGDVESSYAFQRMTSNIVTGKQRRNQQLKREYNMAAPEGAALRATPTDNAPPVAAAAKGARLKVLTRTGSKARVRDDAGNEGWIDQAQLKAY